MKVIIDIPDDHKRVIDNLVEDGKGYLLPYEVENQMALAIRNGKVLSDMTNGDMIKAMFPNVQVVDAGIHRITVIFGDSHNRMYRNSYDEDWWNAPYKSEKWVNFAKELKDVFEDEAEE